MKWRLVVPLALSAACVSLCLAQTSAVITIEVKDPGEAAIAGAQISVVAISEKSAATKVLQTDNSGTLSLNLPFGTYDVSVKMNAFRPVNKQIVVSNTSSQTIPIVLQVGACPPGCVVVPETILRPAFSSDYSRHSVAELIDDLTHIDSQSPGINSAAVHEDSLRTRPPAHFRWVCSASLRPKCQCR